MKSLGTSLTLAILLLSVGLSTAHAQVAETVDWTGGASDGLFNTAGNWDPARVPGSDPDNFIDTAQFGVSGALTVEFTGDTTLSRITNTGTLSDEIAPVVTLDLGGNTVDLTGTGTNNDMSFFTSGVYGRGYIVTGGGTLNTQTMGFNEFTGNARTPSLTITGAGTVVSPLILQSTGSNLSATVTVSDGASLAMPDVGSDSWAMRLEAASTIVNIDTGGQYLGRTTAGNKYVSHVASAAGQTAHITVSSSSNYETDGISLGIAFLRRRR